VGRSRGHQQLVGIKGSVGRCALHGKARAAADRARDKGGEVDGKSAPVAFVGFRFDTRGRTLTEPGGKAVQLTPAEFAMLAAFAKAPGRVLSRDFLLDAIARGGDAPGERVVDVVVGRLRKKLGDDPRNPSLIETVTGFGYLLQTDS
jgi:DNA-binding response OmpR family regulator